MLVIISVIIIVGNISVTIIVVSLNVVRFPNSRGSKLTSLIVTIIIVVTISLTIIVVTISVTIIVVTRGNNGKSRSLARFL